MEHMRNITLLILSALIAFWAIQPAMAADGSQPDRASTEAFNAMLKNYFPLSPGQIHQFKNRASEQAQANATPPGAAPAEGVSSIIRVKVNGGGAMPVVRVGQGFITSLVFTDKAGHVWPISSYSIGDPSAFSIQWDKKGGVLMVQGQKLFAQTNMAVMLQGMKIPVMITLLIGQKQWDYLDYIRVQSMQPGEVDFSAADNTQAPDYLIKLLDGVPPMGSAPLTVSGGDAKVWSYAGQYLLLSNATLVSPAWTSKFIGTGPNPLKAYELPATPYVLLSNNGQIERLTISGGASQ